MDVATTLQLEVVRSPVGVVWDTFGAVFGPFGLQAGPKSTSNDTDRTSQKLKLQTHELQPRPQIAQNLGHGTFTEECEHPAEHDSSTAKVLTQPDYQRHH